MEEDKTSQRRKIRTKQHKIRNARIIRQKEAKRKAKHKLVGRREPARKTYQNKKKDNKKENMQQN
jgi:hypothetical protein